MLAVTEYNQLFLKTYLTEGHTINTPFYQESWQDTQQDKFKLTTDQVILAYSLESITTYNRSMSPVNTANDGYDQLIGLVLNSFKEQGVGYTAATDNSEIDASTINPDQAQELIADIGYFGVEKTSERIYKFSVGMAGDDPSRIAAIRQGVEKGFQEALDAFGGWLPEISHETYDTVMNKLDDWADIDNSPQSQA